MYLGDYYVGVRNVATDDLEGYLQMNSIDCCCCWIVELNDWEVWEWFGLWYAFVSDAG